MHEKERNSECKKSGPWPLISVPHLMFSKRHLILKLDNLFGNKDYIAYKKGKQAEVLNFSPYHFMYYNEM